jgi:hypothetical protein
MLRIRRPKWTRRAKPPWTRVEVAVGDTLHHGRYRMEDGKLVVEGRGGREALSCGLVRPDVVAEQWLRVHTGDYAH